MHEQTIKHPFWWQDAPLDQGLQQDLQAESDAVIIGAGYTGLTAAITLAKAGKSVQVFEKEQPGFGASSRNGGITSGNLALGVSAAIKKYGKQKATEIFKEGVTARQHLRELINDNQIECDYQLTGRFTGALTTADLDNMSKESELLQSLTDIELSIVQKNDLNDHIGSAAYVGGIDRADIGHFHPGKFHRGLLLAARKAGVLVHGETPVTSVDTKHGETADKNGLLHVTSSRGSVAAQQVLVATNGYGDDSNPWIQRRVVPVVSRIVVTEKLSRNLVSSLMPNLRAMGENRKLYRYFRPSPDGERIVFGSREPILNNTEERAIEHIRKGMVDIFPEVKDAVIDYSWGGYVAFNRASLPLLFEREGLHYAMGYCGSGTVWAPWMGRLAAERMLNKMSTSIRDIENLQPGDPGYSSVAANAPAAIPLYNGKPWFLPFTLGWYGFEDRRKGRSS